MERTVKGETTTMMVTSTVRSDRSKRLRALQAALAALVFFAATLVAAPPADASADLQLRFSFNGNPIDSELLDGATIPAEANLAIWLGPRLHPAKKVDFYLNGEHVRTEWSAPFDFSGTKRDQGPKSMQASDLRAGVNVIEARVDGWFNRDRTVRATFTRASSASTTLPGLGLDFSAADAVLSDFVDEENINGAGVVVVHRDHGIVHESYSGVFGPDRVSLIASTGKMLSAGVLLRASEQPDSAFDIEGDVTDVVGWADGLPGVTTADLLSNTSGMSELAGLGYVLNPCGLNVFGELQRCAEASANNPLDDFDQKTPNTVYRYGGPQWQVAGGIAESVTGKSWDQLVAETYTEPCDLNVLGFSNLGQFNLLATGARIYPGAFDGDVSRLTPTRNPTIEGGGYTTPHDYAKLLLMLLRGGKCGDTQVLSPDAIDLMLTDRLGEFGLETGAGTGYGMGWQVDGPVRKDPGFFGAISWLDLEDGYGVYFVIENVALPGQGGGDDLINAIDEAVNASDLEKPAPCVVTAPGANRVQLRWTNLDAGPYNIRRNGRWVRSVARIPSAVVDGSVNDDWVVRYVEDGQRVELVCTTG